MSQSNSYNSDVFSFGGYIDESTSSLLSIPSTGNNSPSINGGYDSNLDDLMPKLQLTDNEPGSLIFNEPLPFDNPFDGDSVDTPVESPLINIPVDDSDDDSDDIPVESPLIDNPVDDSDDNPVESPLIDNPVDDSPVTHVGGSNKAIYDFLNNISTLH
tara:strand:+ start:142 stop:615 length:474 start_codon:yes stop_codon:yes gene_type:complete